MAQVPALDPLEDAASFGRWWHCSASGVLSLSARAAAYLYVEAGEHASASDGFFNVEADDLLPLLATLQQAYEGLVGTVWQTGTASWVEDMSNDPQFLRRKGAMACLLLSG
jgi:hypothetical protein